MNDNNYSQTKTNVFITNPSTNKIIKNTYVEPRVIVPHDVPTLIQQPQC